MEFGWQIPVGVAASSRVSARHTSHIRRSGAHLQKTAWTRLFVSGELIGRFLPVCLRRSRPKCARHDGDDCHLKRLARWQLKIVVRGNLIGLKKAPTNFAPGQTEPFVVSARSD